MIENAKAAEEQAVLQTARQMCAAARTAPKGRGVDHLYTCIVTGQDLCALAEEMERLAETLDYAFFIRDAKNVRDSQAVVLIGCTYGQRGLGEGCSLCNHKGCDECEAKNGVCAFDTIDLGIAVGSATALAADARIDSRVMFSAGKAALSLGMFDREVKAVMAIPLCVSSKSPYFDRK